MAIQIVSYSEVTDNYGKTESSTMGDQIYSALNNVDEWSDDIVFYDNNGCQYWIDDLAGKEVYVSSIGTFTVPTD